MTMDMGIMKTISIAVKWVAFILMMIGVGFVSFFTKEYSDELSKGNPKPDPYDLGQLGRYEFYLCTVIIGLVIEHIGFVCVLRGYLLKKHSAMCMAVVQALWALQLMISTALLARVLTTYQKEISPGQSYCDYWDELPERKYKYTCTQLTIGVVCGFLAMATFAVDSIISTIFVLKSEN
ncbi:uncharacterized protein LOC114517362 [Dendronephthya gigantea]|uniref:uncharacterized protein LOC114517362 n=1 Tax=Dendronephthya gigantea TaxID=151771 RepID=UPI00106D33CD|nr:uncharacterized protein LOC114517362 [Dendronephthya gigantea]